MSMVLNVNVGRIWTHEGREFLFSDLWNNPGLHEIRWKEDFITTQRTFEYIVHLVQPFIAKRDTQFRKAIPVEKSAVAKSAAVEIANEGITEMASDFIVFLKTDRETAEAIIRFAEFSNCRIPQVFDVTDGVQIEVIGLSNDGKVDYFNTKQHYSINTQATIGANLVFLDLVIGFLGSVLDSCVSRCSILY